MLWMLQHMLRNVDSYQQMRVYVLLANLDWTPPAYEMQILRRWSRAPSDWQHLVVPSLVMMINDWWLICQPLSDFATSLLAANPTFLQPAWTIEAFACCHVLMRSMVARCAALVKTVAFSSRLKHDRLWQLFDKTTVLCTMDIATLWG